MGGSSSTPAEDPAAKRLRRQQVEDLAKLDDEENTRIKRLFRVGKGMRLFSGSPDMRRPRGNSAVSPTPSRYGVTQKLTGVSQAGATAFKQYMTRLPGGRGVRPPD